MCKDWRPWIMGLFMAASAPQCLAGADNPFGLSDNALITIKYAQQTGRSFFLLMDRGSNQLCIYKRAITECFKVASGRSRTDNMDDPNATRPGVFILEEPKDLGTPFTLIRFDGLRVIHMTSNKRLGQMASGKFALSGGCITPTDEDFYKILDFVDGMPLEKVYRDPQNPHDYQWGKLIIITPLGDAKNFWGMDKKGYDHE